MRYIIFLVCAALLTTAAVAGPLTNLRARFQRHEPTQVIAQQRATKTVTRERSLLTNRQRAPAGPLSLPGQPAPSQAPTAPPKAPADNSPKTGAKPTASLSADESRMVAAINAYRADYSLPPLTADPLLERIARSRVGVFNHQHPRFGWVWQHAHSLGFPGPALNTTCTDDLAKGDLTPEDAVQGWAHSSVGHAEQMRGKAKMNGTWQDCKFNLCGVAREGQNYIAVFGRRENESCGCLEGGQCSCGGNCQCGTR